MKGSIRLAGLGVFRKRKFFGARGRNAATGEQIKIPVRTRLRSTPAKAPRESVLDGTAAAAPQEKPAAAKAARKK
jgi:nucleoid DNA-binding protein